MSHRDKKETSADTKIWLQKAITPGMILQERYRIEKELGRGGMGQVLQVKDLAEDNKIKAIKRMLGEDEIACKRFQREYRLLNSIHYPHLVHAYDYFEEKNSLFMVLEFVEGMSMSQILEKGNREFCLYEQLAISNKVARAVEILHKAGIIHRDIKPSNIMIDQKSGSVKLIDLGIGKYCNDNQKLTMKDTILGSIPYMSPEQIQWKEATYKSDIFSLATTLYQFFLWLPQSPFWDSGQFAMMEKVEYVTPVSIYDYKSKHEKIIPQEEEAWHGISDLIAEAMDKSPEKRTKKAEIIAERCEAIQKNMGVLDKIDTSSERQNLSTVSIKLDAHLIRTLDSLFQENGAAIDTEQFQSPGKKQGSLRHSKTRKSKASGKATLYPFQFLAIFFVLIILVVAIYFVFLQRTEQTAQKNPTQENKENNLAQKNNSNDSGHGKIKDMPDNAFGLPQKIWEGCRYQYQEEWILDMSASVWGMLTTEEQKQYAATYRKCYAEAKKLPLEIKVYVLTTDFILNLIPPGRFWMGSAETEKGHETTEIRHRVVISKPFYMGQTEITQAQWTSAMGKGKSYFCNDGENKPAECISWDDSHKFCKATETRLPTEAEWEYACRAGVTGSFFWGDNWDRNLLNSASLWAKKDLTSQQIWNKEFGNGEKWKRLGAQTTKVRSFQPNAWGLYDMAGNVFEWCEDHTNGGGQHAINETYKDGIVDPLGREGKSRLIRGGSWDVFIILCRSASRYVAIPSHAEANLGFRVVKLP